MPDVKVAVVGAASHVFGAGVLEQALTDGRLDGVHLAPMDIDAEGVELMTALGRRLTDEFGRRGSRKLVHEAVESDPTVTDKSAGIEAIDECLKAHEDLIGPMGA